MTNNTDLHVVYDKDAKLSDGKSVPFKVSSGKYKNVVFTISNMKMNEINEDDAEVSYELTVLEDPDIILKTERTKKSFDKSVSKFVTRLITE